jgi:hypothetical protein
VIPTGLLCSPTQAAISADSYSRQQRYDLGQVFGVLVRGDADTAFLDADDAGFREPLPRDADPMPSASRRSGDRRG